MIVAAAFRIALFLGHFTICGANGGIEASTG